MARVKRGFKARRRRKGVLERAKGFRGSRSTRYRTAAHVVKKALSYAYRDRKVKKRDFRRLWIIRISAAVRTEGMKYSSFIHGLNQAGIELDRSVLADMCIRDKDGFSQIVEKARQALSA
ncbi:MAG: 50S ribosomal protein L20 [Oligoflexales bacterium]